MVPLLRPGSTVVCLATGPSLCREDLVLCASHPVMAVAVNDACFWAPWAQVFYASDVNWWRRQPQAVASHAMKFTLPPRLSDTDPSIDVLRNTGMSGVELDPTGVKCGGHSGYAAINVAVHLGAKQIVLLGYDMQPGPNGEHHCFGEHPNRSHPRYHQWLAMYETLLAPLYHLGISIVNASRQTAITAIPRQSLAEALADA